jgi:integrase
MTITQKQIDALKIGEQLEDNGLRIRRRESGKITFGYRCRIDGVRREFKLGVGLTLKQALDAASKCRGERALGINIVAVKEQATARAANTVDAVLDRWFSMKATEYRSFANIKHTIDRYVRPRFGATVIYDLNRDVTAPWLDEIALAHPTTARHVRSYFSMALEWHAERDSKFAGAGVLPKARALPAIAKRDRVLADDEIRDVWLACDDLTSVFAPLVRTLLLTACRRDEVGQMTTDELSANGHGAVWTIPGARMKNGRQHVVPLNDAISAQLPRRESGYLFRVSDAATKPFSAWSECKGQLDRAIARRRAAEGRKPMAPWVLHDLRRTASTKMNEIGIAERVVEACLSHTIAGVAGVYNRYDYLAEKRAALEAWARHVDAIVSGSAGANVVAYASARPARRQSVVGM